MWPYTFEGLVSRMVLKENIIQKLSVFERKILRKVFGATKKKRWKLENQNEYRIG